MEIANAATLTSQSVGVNTSALSAIASASPVVQFTLFILVSLSVLCWAVGISKYKQFRALAEANNRFLSHFWKASSFDSLYETLDQYRNSSIARVFKAGYVELQKLAKANASNSETKELELQLGGIANLERTLRKSMDLEVSDLESRLTLLATTGSTGPFIGLFGTVWGIMGSFHKIGAMGSASLAVVAPGISEALIATAIGLAAAIPAVVLYNNFIATIKKEEVALSTFSNDFLNIAKRNFFKES